MQQIKTFEEACTTLKISNQVPDFSSSPEKHQAALIAHYKLVIIAEAMNEGWIPDWNNDDEYKYYPWFDMEKSDSNPGGVGLLDVDCYDSYSFVGSRLCFKSREIAKYVAEQFTDLYKEYMMIK